MPEPIRPSRLPRQPLSNPTPARGFTLIEVLVVLLIIGVLATLVSLSVSGRAVDDRMEAETRRLERLMQLAADEAQAKGLELGFRITDEGLEFLSPNNGGSGWAVVQEGLFRPREIPPPMQLELHIDGRRQKPVQTSDDEASTSVRGLDLDQSERIEPQVLILSSGEVTPFTLDVVLPENPAFYRVEGNALGQFHYERLQRERS